VCVCVSLCVYVCYVHACVHMNIPGGWGAGAYACIIGIGARGPWLPHL
jgi:hypothetical protein